MFVSPVSSSMDGACESPADSANPTPTFITLVVLTTFTWSTGDGRR
jgi:hypothetical protein